MDLSLNTILAQGLPLKKNNPIALQKSSDNIKDIKKVAREYESLFISQFLQQYTENVGNEEDSVLGGGQGAEIYKSLLNDEYGKAIAEQGGFGIADSIYNQLIDAKNRITDDNIDI